MDRVDAFVARVHRRQVVFFLGALLAVAVVTACGL